MVDRVKLVSITDASKWATKAINKKVTTANIQYLINYGRVDTYSYEGSVLVDLESLQEYYSNRDKQIKDLYVANFGKNINWNLSFDSYSESETTKHVHKLHPYKGKYIPQLVEYFLDEKNR